MRLLIGVVSFLSLVVAIVLCASLHHSLMRRCSTRAPSTADDAAVRLLRSAAPLVTLRSHSAADPNSAAFRMRHPHRIRLMLLVLLHRAVDSIAMLAAAAGPRWMCVGASGMLLLLP